MYLPFPTPFSYSYPQWYHRSITRISQTSSTDLLTHSVARSHTMSINWPLYQHKQGVCMCVCVCVCVCGGGGDNTALWPQVICLKAESLITDHTHTSYTSPTYTADSFPRLLTPLLSALDWCTSLHWHISPYANFYFWRCENSQITVSISCSITLKKQPVRLELVTWRCMSSLDLDFIFSYGHEELSDIPVLHRYVSNTVIKAQAKYTLCTYPALQEQ